MPGRFSYALIIILGGRRLQPAIMLVNLGLHNLKVAAACQMKKRLHHVEEKIRAKKGPLSLREEG